MKNIQDMIVERGGLEAVYRNYLRIENPPFMRLVIEVLGQPFPSGACEVSVAHYSVQNGDAMRDPEITFLVIPKQEGQWEWKPLTFLNDYLGAYQVAAECDQFGSISVHDARLVRELGEFANTWDRNVKHQGFIEAFRKQYGQPANGAQNGATHAVS